MGFVSESMLALKCGTGFLTSVSCFIVSVFSYSLTSSDHVILGH